MADVLDTVQKFVNSRPGQLAAGGVLAGIVWKFFERVEAVLTDNTKLEIAVWLLDREKLSPTFQNWASTFEEVFEHVFGAKHWSLRCFMVSALCTVGLVLCILRVLHLELFNAVVHIVPPGVRIEALPVTQVGEAANADGEQHSTLFAEFLPACLGNLCLHPFTAHAGRR